VVNDNVSTSPALTAAHASLGRELPRASMPSAGEPLRVRRIQPGEPLGDVQRLRREVYFQEQGRNDKLHSRRVADGLDASGTIVVVEEGRKAVATLRLHDFGSPAVQVEYGSLFQIDRFARTWPLERVAVCTRFAVQAERRAKAVIDALVEETYRHAHEHGIQFGLIACEPYLYSVLDHYGFREYLPPAVLPSGLALLRMGLVVDAAALLHECESPLLPLVRNPVAGNAAQGWLMRTFPEKISPL
jgi:hypothetical protein